MDLPGAPAQVTIRTRTGQSAAGAGQWATSVVSTDPVGGRNDEDPRPYVRSATIHTEADTGVSALFAGTGTGEVHRGVYDPDAPGSIRWAGTPDLSPTAGRVLSMTVANGALYAAAAVELRNGSPAGGLYQRIDAPTPSWELVYRWDPPRTGYGGMRGLTAVNGPDGSQFLLGAREEPGVIERIDPADDHRVTVEYDIRGAYQQLWDGPSRGPTLAAYNDMLQVPDPSGETSHLIGLWVNHPQRTTPPFNGSNYLVRAEDGTYRQGVVLDPDQPVPAGRELRATRTILPSPFDDEPNTIYFAGFDAGGRGKFENTAWIYRGRPAA